MYIKKILTAIVLIGLVVAAFFANYVYSAMFKPNTSFENEEVYVYIFSNSNYENVRTQLTPLLNDIDKFDFYIYPNLLAAKQIITIEPNYITKGNLEIIIMDLNGRIISRDKKAQRDRKIKVTAPETRGSYVVSIQSQGKLIYSEKIIVY